MTLTQKIKEVFHKHDHADGEHHTADKHHHAGEHHATDKHHATGEHHLGATTIAAEGLPIAHADADELTATHDHSHLNNHLPAQPHTGVHPHTDAVHPHTDAHNHAGVHPHTGAHPHTDVHNHAGPSTQAATYTNTTDPLDHHHSKSLQGPAKMKELEAHLREDGFMPPANNGSALR